MALKDKTKNESQSDLSGNTTPIERKVLLKTKFLVPPFSVIDTKTGDWLQRRRKWLNLTGNLEESREDTLFGLNKDSKSEVVKKILELGTTSHFDPALAELIYKWFNIPGGKIIDPFGGEQTKGVVAGVLKYPYQSVEFRQEQVDINNIKCRDYPNVKYICGNSEKISDLISDSDFDLCFTSPPYYDLEVYSKEDASAIGTYEDFMFFYYKVFKQIYDKLNPNRFLVLKIGEIRDKKTGEYRNFVGDNIKIMKRIGFKYYNEIILLNSIGTASLRCQPAFKKNRKVCKIHQNILVFYKGDMKKIKENFEEGI